MEDKERANTILKKVHPQKKANLLSRIFFCWPLPIFAKGFKKDLTEDDMYGPLDCHLSDGLGDRLEEAWNTEIAHHKKPSLWRVIAKVHWKETALYGLVFAVTELLVKMAQPLIIGLVMSYYVPNQTTVTIEQAYLYAAGLALTTFFNVLLTNFFILGLLQLGMKIRIALCSLIYRKALRLSKSAMATATVGQMVNLMSNDVNRFNYVMILIHHLWMAPIEAIVILYLLYSSVDAAALTGTSILLAFVPLQLFIGKLTSKYRMRTAIKTDQRVRLMNEIVTGIQVIKMYTWEKPFSKLVEMARKLEIHQIKSASYLRAVNFSFMIFLNRASIYLSVITYVLTGHTLQAQYVYVVTSFYNSLRAAITMFLPMSITMLAETNVAVERIQKFLSYDEVGKPETQPEPTERYTEMSTNGTLQIKNGSIPFLKQEMQKKIVGINVEDAFVKWIPTQDYTLSNINFKASPGELVAVIGTVGSGKSTLFHLLLRELLLDKGELEVEGIISYASQEPWLFASSIRQNILFGQEMDGKRYKEIVKVCALERDFSMFPHGDRTIVGERGVMLSGGQKARINLARAIYKDSDIYLLDDPLSSVDAHVGKQLYDDCISNFLKNKCVVLITHQLQYLNSADRIYLMDNGTITASGTYAELQNSKEEFLKLLQDKPEEDEEEEVKKVKKARSTRSLNKVDLPTLVKEQRSSGAIAKRIYSRYVTAGRGWLIYSVLFSFFVLAQLGGSLTDYFLSYWVNLEQAREEERYKESMSNYTENAAASNETSSLGFFLETFLTSSNCIYIYSGLMAFIIVMALTRSLCFFKFAMTASTRLHNNMFSRIVYTAMRFFNTNPSGRILNRFSKDMGAIDEILPQAIIDTTQIGLSVLGISVVISIVSPWILLPTVVVFVIFYCYRVIYLATSRDLKRMDGTTRSPVFTHITASLQGLTTIRAFGAQKMLMKEFDQHQDLHSSVFYIIIACDMAFGFWMDMNCVVYTALVTTSFLFMGTESYSGNVGLAITQALALTGMLQHGMMQWSELENQMTSVERVIEYTEIPSESDDGKLIPPKSWPAEGNVEFDSVSMQYAPDDPFVLKELEFKIKAMEKVGIVGRTGAGKSSLISALFRLTQIKGRILIDNINTKDVPLDRLRSKISIIPQEPVLFSGTLSRNLDPFDEYEDAQLWDALEEVELKNLISDMPLGLQYAVSEGGSNFSVGQRQLLCLARAVIRHNRILILDEATANVDPQTDELIQNTIRTKFKDCTVLTIAHRLHTVMDSDKILVMDSGRAVEFDSPHVLLQKTDGIFYGLVRQTGRGMSDNLMSIAEESYNKGQDFAEN